MSRDTAQSGGVDGTLPPRFDDHSGFGSSSTRRQRQVETLYPQLRARPGAAPDAVRRNQRARLLAAMVEAVAEDGYVATTTRRLSALAGVSQRTLYEHFASKEDYFLATYDETVQAGIERIAAAYRDGGGGWTEGLCRAFEAFAAEVAECPKPSRLALVEVLAAGPAALERVEVGEALFEQMIARGFAQAPEPLQLPPVLLKGVVNGILCVARRRLLEGSPEAISDCGHELLDWLLCYRSPALAALGKPAAGEPVPAPAATPPTPLNGDERRRAMSAAARIAAEHGYAALSVARICEEAEVTPPRFFEFFGDAEECFLGALELLSAQALARALRESEGAPSWPAAVCRAARGFLRQIAEDPIFARAAFVETFGAGRAGVERRAALVGSFADVLVRRSPRGRRPSPLVAEAIIGAGWGIAHHYVAHDRARHLPLLAGHAAYLVLAPVLGAEAAVEAIEAELGDPDMRTRAPGAGGAGVAALDHVAVNRPSVTAAASASRSAAAPAPAAPR